MRVHALVTARLRISRAFTQDFIQTMVQIPSLFVFQPRRAKRKLEHKGKSARRRSVRAAGSRQPHYAERCASSHALRTLDYCGRRFQGCAAGAAWPSSNSMTGVGVRLLHATMVAACTLLVCASVDSNAVHQLPAHE